MTSKINPDLQHLARSIDSVRERPNNERDHSEEIDLPAIAESLDVHGQLKPIVVNDEGEALAGNGTLRAARDILGWDSIAAVLYDGTEALQIAYGIRDNRTAELSTWNYPNLAASIDLLPEAERESVGFTSEEIAQFTSHFPEVTNTEPGEGYGEQTAESDRFFTPAEIIARARSVMGGIDLDPASEEQANRVVEARHFYTEADDGLTLPWDGKVWCNPPYSGTNAGDFVDKAVTEFEAGRAEQICILVNANTDSGWFVHLWDRPICFMRGRLRFLDPVTLTATPDSARSGSVVSYFGDNVREFCEAFNDVGHIVIPRPWILEFGDG